jgi:hypothetical protein
MSRAQGSKTIDGLRIIPHIPYDLADLTQVIEALKLIQKVDPRRYDSVKRNIRTIVLAARTRKRLGRYTPAIKECQLGQVPVPENARFAPVYCYAMVLIHEATHGRLCNQFIPHTTSTKQRVEKACHKEEKRFLQKLADTDWSRWEVFTAYLAMIAERKHAGPQVRFVMTQ